MGLIGGTETISTTMDLTAIFNNWSNRMNNNLNWASSNSNGFNGLNGNWLNMMSGWNGIRGLGGRGGGSRSQIGGSNRGGRAMYG